ncbi:MAG: xanthine dehydrogenase family protein molybdopterin-binding subunit [Alphaproteobacteria bacterium]
MSAESFGISQHVLRREDVRLLTGGGSYTDDISMPGETYAAFARSPFGHGTINAVDVAEAKGAPGVLAVYTGADLEAAGIGPLPNATPFKSSDGSAIIVPPRPALAVGRVRHAGEPVAVVIAETASQAADAAELIYADIDPLPAVIDPAAAIADGAPLLHDEAPGNVALDQAVGDAEAVDAAFAGAAHVTKLTLTTNRLVGNAMEPRSAVAGYDAASETFELVSGSQGVNVMRGMLARAVFKVPPEKMHVVTRDVGGGFGIKTQPYPEYVAILFAARALGRPVKWRGTRGEGFLADNQARDGVLTGEMAFDGNGNVLALRVYLSSHGPWAATRNVFNCLTGVYKTPAIHFRSRCMFTNAAPIGPYRGAGRPEAAYIVERLMDNAARELGIDRVELRRRNMIPASAMPYATPLDQVYDSGDFAGAMDDALKLAGWDGFAARKAESEATGRLRGIGMACFVETAGGVLEEGAKIGFAGDGPEGIRVEVRLAAQSNGQGHATSFAQVVAERLQVPYDKVVIIEGDSAETPEVGAASTASRTMALAGSAVALTCDSVIEKGKTLAGHVLEAAAADIEYAEGSFRIAGTDRAIGLIELARDIRGRALPEGAPASLDSAEVFTSPEQTYPNGCHICEVEIDPTTGVVDVLAYSAVDDCGTVVNPMIVHGQVHGGVAQGLGQVLGEHAVYDDDGQLLAGSFMDYMMPRADDIPDFRLGFHPTHCTTNPLGAKGAGEAGTTGALAAGMNAIVDALAGHGVVAMDMPATPAKIWAALNGS